MATHVISPNFHMQEPNVPRGMPIRSLIAFKACNDLGLGALPIAARHSNNGKKQAAVERGGASSAGGLFGRGVHWGRWPPQGISAVTKDSNSIKWNNSVRAVCMKLTILYKRRAVAEVRF
jgi:hypothetical protein